MIALPWPFSSLTSSSNCTCALKCGHDSQCPLYNSEKAEHEAEDAVARLLAHYATPSGACPPSARVDPALTVRAQERLSISDLWYFGTFVASKTTDLAIDFALHHTRGPRKKSWGIEMTLITSFMRGVARHTRLADIAMLRLFMQLGSLVPPPPDALVTPVSFRIRSRQLRGLLAPFDELEYGGAQRPKAQSESDEPRELSGEWIVGKELWTRLNKQWLHEKRHHGVGHRIPERVILYLHGGAYYVFSAATHRLITITLSKYADARVFAVNYRLAPETRFPGALHDAVHAYRRLTDELHVPPSRILVAGDSAGGGLALALLMYLRDEGYELPSGAILFSPWVDLTMSCDSWDSNADVDVVPRPDADDPLNPVACYLGWGESMKKYITHPYASPLFGDFKGLPPLLVQSGDSEVLRDEITLLAHKATLAGVDVRHELFEDAVHVFQMFPFLPATRRAFQNVRSFVKQLDAKSSTTPPAHSVASSDSGSPDLGLGSDAERDLRDEMNANAESSHVVRTDGQEVATGRMAGLKLADGEQETDSEQSTPENGLGLDLGAPTDTHTSTVHTRPHPYTPRRHHRGLTSPIIRMTPITPSASTVSSPNNLPRSLSSSWMTVSPVTSAPQTPRATSPVPTPSIRLRNRALSHPDVADLVASFAARPEMVRTTTFSACGDENDE
ncbi:lipase/esterase from carbohydrate esterase family CE10 protein, putative [Rhizoctonia solani AG-3 Rhs1AP]|uniref:Lipase/esterase from carbohydrate esterase family CE10 protein, putative n=2 Tax=Rhizoctonia solani AG-3 TaxID=1086053 RepID=X8J5Y3_9AGAM|nr:lipase/esterase from carbohydrate esterase family CE10 protein, putative [Rhizoctonia solani AG-3 Rhs1AP]KEP50369.1 putative lipase/esterase from carbohydrate esterase family CE10 protein [Rhizoctonia solani 123E]